MMKITTIRGVGVYIHWSFWLLMIIYLFPILASFGLASAAIAGLFIGGIFASVVAHEFGHSAAAARYGIKTADITLLPIGGVARLERLPRSPIEELVIALAGPAVNVVISAALYLLILLGIRAGISAPAIPTAADVLVQWMVANLFLCGFNLLPAFPMDGGRVLRGLLAMQISYLRATEIAARVGRWMALFFIVAAIMYSAWPLALIAAFIFFAGTAELFQVRFREMVRQAGNDGRPTSPGPTWLHRSWPEQAGSYHKEGDSDEVIDAIEVREIK